jgi:threonine dehydratase
MLGFQDILAAQRTLSGLITKTPLEYSFLLSQLRDHDRTIEYNNMEVKKQK